MARASLTSDRQAPFLDTVRGLPFVRQAALTPRGANERLDGTLTLTAGKDRYEFYTVQKLSYLDQASVHALKSLAATAKRPLVLFARYIPRPTGEQLIEAGINFIDLAGNIHLALGRKFDRTVLGHRETSKGLGGRALTAAQVQLLFAVMADPKSLDRPVRDLARDTGVSKSTVANLRRDLATRWGQASKDALRRREEELLRGYTQVLRPKLFLGRFRAAEATVSETFERIQKTMQELDVRISLTGGPAAERLQRFYHTADLLLFVDSWTPALRSQLRLMPDREGPITLLRAFGELPFWKTVEGIYVAHPWLIYAELLQADDPRAHEAADELRRDYLHA